MDRAMVVVVLSVRRVGRKEEEKRREKSEKRKMEEKKQKSLTDCGNRRQDLADVQLVEDRGLARGVEAEHDDLGKDERG